jgi:hypothetical protein
MVINKDTECIDIFEVIIIRSPPISNIFHAFSVNPHVSNGKFHGIVKDSSYIVLVVRNIMFIAMIAITHLKDTCRCNELLPEAFLNITNCVDPDAIEIVCCD